MSVALDTNTAPVFRTIKRDLRASIVDAAWSIGNEEVPEKLTVRNIATRAGVSPALLYTYFADKAALLLELQRLAEPELASTLKLVIAGAGTPRECLLRVCTAYVGFARRHCWLYEGHAKDTARHGSTGPARLFAEQVGALLDEIATEHTSTEHAALMLRTAIDALVAAQVHEQSSELGSGEFVDRYVQMVLRGL